MKRILCLWLPHLSIERLHRHDPQQEPWVASAEHKSALRLVAMNRPARHMGLSRGMTLTDARALAPRLKNVERDAQADARSMVALARWAGRYSPFVAREPVPDGAGMLVLDITGCAHLFGGEASMLAEMSARLTRNGLTVFGSIADTKGAAIALARWGKGGIASLGETRRALASLPVAALRLDPKSCEGLARLGLHTVGSLARLPRAALARRFGMETITAIDRAFGDAPEPISPDPPPPIYSVRLTLPEPIGKTEDVMAALERLNQRLCERLEREQLGARRLRLTIFRADHTHQSAEIGLARPSADPARIRILFEKPVDGLEARFGIDAVRLEAAQVEAVLSKQLASNVMPPMQGCSAGDREAYGSNGSSGSEVAHIDDTLTDLIGVIGNRIGFERVQRFLSAESHIPERGFTRAAAAYSEYEPFAYRGPPRPFALFAPEPVELLSGGRPPQRFRWRGALWRVTHAEGPERIAPEWWWDDPAWRSGTRDYWRIETETGHRHWLFQALGFSAASHNAIQTQGGWFVTGSFA